MEKFCKEVKEHATQIINYEKKRNDTIKKRRKENTLQPKNVIYAKKDLVQKMTIKNTIK